ncbi:MAG: tetratricopeptide repeat protein [Bryobacterales bacterium]|nr:tetratricopeptide repeat protein [Bryobacterales bacterium]
MPPPPLLSQPEAVPPSGALPEWLSRAFLTSVKHYQAGLYEEARQLLIAILEREPRHSDSLYLLGSIAAQSRDLDLAAEMLRQALAIEHRKPVYWVLYGNILQYKGDWEASGECYRAALTLDPNHTDAYYNWGNTFERQQRNREATACFEAALRLMPAHIQARNNLANQYRNAGRPEEAAAHLEQAHRQEPSSVPVILNLGNVYMALNRHADAVACFDAAIKLAPAMSVLYSNKGNALRALTRIDESLAAYGQAIALEPGRAEFHVNRGIAQQMQGRLSEALDSFRQAMHLAPENAAAYGAGLFSLHYDPALSPDDLCQAHREWASRYAPPPTPRRYSNVRDAERRLRIGLLSADFRQHPVTFFTLPLIEQHDEERYEILCYSSGGKADAWTQRLRNNAEGWCDASGLTDLELAEQMERDEIDIAVDLSGHTAGNRLLALARKPAPVAISWLGYFNTTGLAAIDYLMVDSIVAPPAEEAPFVEQPLRLDGCYLAYQGPDYAPEVSPLPAAPRGHITFGCFNTLSKVTPEAVKLWAELLRRVPRSRLILKNSVLDDGHSRQLYWEAFAREGIHRHRVDLVGSSPHRELLAHYANIDIALDTSPYNGGTTTCEALWMGVPVITQAGDRFVSRVGATILTNAGFPAWVTHSPQDYLARAAALAADPARLADIRATLRHTVRQSTLGDTAQFTRRWEHALRMVWHNWIRSAR